jgi:hypothetical protein
LPIALAVAREGRRCDCRCADHASRSRRLYVRHPGSRTRQ